MTSTMLYLKFCYKTQDSSPKSYCQVNILLGTRCPGATTICTSGVAYGKFNPRLLVMSATGDSNAQYMIYMNLFNNQKLNIPLVTCMILQDSELVQQCCDITGGSMSRWSS